MPTMEDAPVWMRYPRPIRRALLSGIVALIGLAILTGTLLTVVLGGTLEAISQEVARVDGLAEQSARLRSALLDQETGIRGYQLTGDDAFLQPYRAGMRAEAGALEDLIAGPSSEGLRAATFEVSRRANEWRSDWAERQRALTATGDFDAVREAVTTGVGRRLFEQLRGALGRVDIEIDDMRAAQLASLDEAEHSVDRTIVAGVAVLGFGLVLGALWIVSRVARPLDELVRTAEALERGEAVELVARRDDEIGTLAKTIDRLQRSVRQRYETAASLAERSAILNRLSELVSYADDETAVIRAGSAAFERLVPSQGGETMLINPSFDQLRVHSGWGELSTPIHGPLAVDRPTACPGIRRNAVHVTRSALDAFSLTCDVHPLRSGSLLCVPLVSHNETIGVVHVERPEEDAFDEEDVATAGRVAEQVALAMVNLRLMDRMERQAMTDPLTGLANPRSFDPLVERELTIAARDAQAVAIVMLDLDHFKQFNDTYGHPAGDEALRSFARTVRGALRQSDAVARYGGEEFAILLRNTDLAGARAVAEKVRSAIESTPIEIGPDRFARITASLGVAATDRHGGDRMHLMRMADAALYRAKQEGRNRVAEARAGQGSTDEVDAVSRPTSIARGERRQAR